MGSFSVGRTGIREHWRAVGECWGQWTRRNASKASQRLNMKVIFHKPRNVPVYRIAEIMDVCETAKVGKIMAFPP